MYCVSEWKDIHFFCSDIQAYLSGFWLRMDGIAKIYCVANASIWKSNESKSRLQHGLRTTTDKDHHGMDSSMARHGSGSWGSKVTLVEDHD